MTKARIRNIIGLFLTAGMTAIAVMLIVRRSDALNFDFVFSATFQSETRMMLFVGAVLLVPVNLGLEALKWHVMGNMLLRFRFGDAYKGVLAGLAAGMFLPNRIGEFAGKSIGLPRKFFWKGSLLAVFLSMTQLLVTLVAGLCALYYFGTWVSAVFQWPWPWLPLAVCAILTAILIYLYFAVHLVSGLFRPQSKAAAVISVLGEIGLSRKWTILMYSVLRYFVFSVQNIFLMYAFGAAIPLTDMFLLFALLYVLMATVPTIAITELPTRGSLMVFIFIAYAGLAWDEVPYGLEAQVLMVSFVIWLINLILPSLPGFYFLSRYSLKSSDPDE